MWKMLLHPHVNQNMMMMMMMMMMIMMMMIMMKMMMMMTMPTTTMMMMSCFSYRGLLFKGRICSWRVPYGWENLISASGDFT